MVNNRFHCQPNWRIIPAAVSNGWTPPNRLVTVCTCSTLTPCKHLVRHFPSTLFIFSFFFFLFVFSREIFSISWTTWLIRSWNAIPKSCVMIYSPSNFFVFCAFSKIVANLLRATQWWDRSAVICKQNPSSSGWWLLRQLDNHSTTL